jgi:CRISPR-associated protein Cas1
LHIFNLKALSVVLSEIFHTRLDPRIAFLHESNERAFSLNLDIAEIFKPLLVDRAILSVINRGEIKKEDFDEKDEGVYLNKKGVKKFVKEFNKRLESTINIPKLNKFLSYRSLIREECYKLCRHFEGKEKYKPFVKVR